MVAATPSGGRGRRRTPRRAAGSAGPEPEGAAEPVGRAEGEEAGERRQTGPPSARRGPGRRPLARRPRRGARAPPPRSRARRVSACCVVAGTRGGGSRRALPGPSARGDHLPDGRLDGAPPRRGSRRAPPPREHAPGDRQQRQHRGDVAEEGGRQPGPRSPTARAGRRRSRPSSRRRRCPWRSAGRRASARIAAWGPCRSFDPDAGADPDREDEGGEVGAKAPAAGRARRRSAPASPSRTGSSVDEPAGERPQDGAADPEERDGGGRRRPGTPNSWRSAGRSGNVLASRRRKRHAGEPEPEPPPPTYARLAHRHVGPNATAPPGGRRRREVTRCGWQPADESLQVARDLARGGAPGASFASATPR
jgi:hypothetical protein